MNKFLISLLAAAFLLSNASAQDDENSNAPENCSRIEASTIFIPDKFGNRQEGSAEEITATHKRIEKLGWDFDSLAPYIEDGDLQGFFVTYTRPAKCQENLSSND